MFAVSYMSYKGEKCQHTADCFRQTCSQLDVDNLIDAAVLLTMYCGGHDQSGQFFWNHVYLESGAWQGVQYACLSCQDVTNLVEVSSRALTLQTSIYILGSMIEKQ